MIYDSFLAEFGRVFTYKRADTGKNVPSYEIKIHLASIDFHKTIVNK